MKNQQKIINRLLKRLNAQMAEAENHILLGLSPAELGELNSATYNIYCEQKLLVKHLKEEIEAIKKTTY